MQYCFGYLCPSSLIFTSRNTVIPFMLAWSHWSHNRGADTKKRVKGGSSSFSGRSLNWSVTDGDGAQGNETCDVLASVVAETETYEGERRKTTPNFKKRAGSQKTCWAMPLAFSSFEVECVATSVGEEASFWEGTACEVGDAQWEPAQPLLWFPDHRSDLKLKKRTNINNQQIMRQKTCSLPIILPLTSIHVFESLLGLLGRLILHVGVALRKVGVDAVHWHVNHFDLAISREDLLDVFLQRHKWKTLGMCINNYMKIHLKYCNPMLSW